MPLPSRSHSYLAIVPSESLEPEPLKLTLCPGVAGLGEAVKEALGGLLSVELYCAEISEVESTRS